MLRGWTRISIVSFAFLLALVLLAPAVAAEKAPAPPKPGPEHQKLAYFLGNWSFEGDAKASPFGPGGKFKGTENCEWFPGHFAVVCHSTGNGPMGEHKGLGILGYSTEDKRYTYYGISSTGMGGETAYGTVEGSTWTWTGDSKVKGKVIHGRYTMVASPDSYSMKSELSEDGTTWTVSEEGTAKRAKAPVKLGKPK